MSRKIKNTLAILFAIAINILIFWGLEWQAGAFLKKHLPANQNLQQMDHPFSEFDKDLKRHIRKDAFTKPPGFYKITTNYKGRDYIIPGILSYDSTEGMVRHEAGDTIINKWGFRGPYLPKEPKTNIIRIVALGGSTTAGQPDSENTYPIILERMLNSFSNGEQFYQVLNAGHWGYTSCEIKKLFRNEISDFKPRLLLLMSGWNDINFLNNANIKKMGHYCLNHDNFINYSNIYRFLKYLIKPRLKKQDSNYDEEIIEKNTGFYLQNIKEIIKEAQGQGMLVSMVNLPSLYEENSPLEQQKLLPQFNSTSMKKMRYVRKAGLKINSLKKRIVNEFPEIEFINNGISFDSRGKALFFC